MKRRARYLPEKKLVGNTTIVSSTAGGAASHAPPRAYLSLFDFLLVWLWMSWLSENREGGKGVSSVGQPPPAG
ncbi:hypothetical protein Hanom_Chr12g01173851 [Helianthus anomalus]